MKRWLISVPVWGDRYHAVFERCAAPALVIAAQRLRDHLLARGEDCDVRFVVHTDNPQRVASSALSEQLTTFRPLPDKPTYVALQESHADALVQAQPGDRVILLNADIVVSGNLLVRADEHFRSGFEAVVLLGIRTAAGDELPPVGAAPRHLLRWAWEHRHQIIRDLEWSSGASMLPTNLFFEQDGNVVARGFHLHPAAVIKRDGLRMISTIDGDLLDNYERERVHVVTSSDDCAMLEVSPPDRRFPVRAGALTPAHVAASMAPRASAMHRWLFESRIEVAGDALRVDADRASCSEISARLAHPPATPPERIVRGRTPTRQIGRRGR